jgi:LacI family transcriptional regulator
MTALSNLFTIGIQIACLQVRSIELELLSMPKATINEVAKLAGVSIKTVSRVVNREKNVRESTRVKVEIAVEQLKYRPNQSARNLASTRSHLIGLLYEDPDMYEIPSAGYIVRLQQGSLKACRSAHYELLIHPCDHRKNNVITELKSLIEEARPAGIILAAPLSNMAEIIATIEATGTPFVRLSPGELNGEQLSVATNDRDACAEMTRYLASLGHTNIAFIKGHHQHMAVANRYLGYQDGLQQSGLELSDRLVAAGDNLFRSGELAAESLLLQDEPPTAVFAANDDMAAGVIRTADRLGIAIPDQLSVAGFDDVALAQQVFPTLTTMRQPLAAMADLAAVSLIGNSNKSESPKGVEIVDAKMIIRDSTGPVPT